MKRLHLLFALAAFTLLDQATKEMAVQARPFPSAMSLLNGVIRFRLTENTGLFMSFGDTFPEPVRFWLFTVTTAAVLGALLVYSLTKPDLPGSLRISIVMMAGGGLSNVIDRFLHEGAVIDFVYLDLYGFRTDIFNLADVIITAGVALLLLHALRVAAARDS